jgi:uncharacterized integral membrane protein
MKKRIRMIAISVIVVLLLVIVLQNTQQVETNILFIEVSMPRALFIVVLFAAGWLTGVLSAWKRLGGRNGAKTD